MHTAKARVYLLVKQVNSLAAGFYAGQRTEAGAGTAGARGRVGITMHEDGHTLGRAGIAQADQVFQVGPHVGGADEGQVEVDDVESHPWKDGMKMVE